MSAIASAVASLVGLAGVAIGYVTLSHISELHAKGELNKLQSLIRSTMLTNALVGFVIFAGLVLFGPTVLELFGEEFAASSDVLMILAAKGLLDITFLYVPG